MPSLSNNHLQSHAFRRDGWILCMCLKIHPHNSEANRRWSCSLPSVSLCETYDIVCLSLRVNLTSPHLTSIHFSSASISSCRPTRISSIFFFFFFIPLHLPSSTPSNTNFKSQLFSQSSKHPSSTIPHLQHTSLTDQSV